MKNAIYPGSFDPFTNGHLDIVKKAAALFDRVHIVIGVNPKKQRSFPPEVIQAAYRIGDSVTNIITPMMSYFGLILAFATRYQKDIGVGTLIAMMLPYSVIFFIGWTALFFLWVFGLGLPVGPGAPTYYTPG